MGRGDRPGHPTRVVGLDHDDGAWRVGEPGHDELDRPRGVDHEHALSDPRITVVGLGPAGPDLLTAGALAAIAGSEHPYLRTTRHPAASILEGAPSFDDLYESSATFDEVYERIVDALVGAARRDGEVLYAVPGSPRVLERSVDLLVAQRDVPVEVLPALSFLDLAWVRLGVDPFEEGVRLVDAHRFADRAAGERGPLLVAHCHSRQVLSDVKLAFDIEAPERAIVLQRLGLPDESIVEVAFADIDRVVEPDHLTALYLPHVAAPVAAEVQRFAALVRLLRERCPWDREQTHSTLTRHLLEETYEVLEAIDSLDEASGEGYAHLEEELGDLLFQVVFHATLATEQGQFTLADVASTIHDKLVLRHPHVFGDVEADTAERVMTNWEQIKRDEKGRESVMDGIPPSLPALLYAHKVQRKAAGLGVQAPLPAGPALRSAREVGAALFATVAAARALDVDPEAALQATARAFRDEVRADELA